MASAANFCEDEICTHCWTRIADMVNPLALPCGHIGCAWCIEEKYKEFGGVNCHACGTIRGVGVDKLPKASYKKAPSATILKCDRHECTKFAGFFCIKCTEKLCQDDKKAHDGYYREGHEMISIQEYKETASKYRKDFCGEHKEEVAIKACEYCKRIICNSCDRSEGDCSDQRGQHSYVELATVAQRCVEELKRLLASAANKTGEFQEINKKAWKQLEADENSFDDWIKAVEKTRDEHIEMLLAAYKVILEDIKRRKKEVQDESVEFNNQLIEKREALEESRSKVYQLVSGGSSADIIKQEEKVKEQLRPQINEKLGDGELSTKFSLVVHDRPVTANVEFIKLPSALTFSSEHPTGYYCYSACHREDGSVLLGCDDGMKLLNKKTMEITSRDLPYKRVVAVIEQTHNIYILHKQKTTQKVEMLLSDTKHVETLFEFENQTNYVAAMAVSDKYIVAYRPTEISRGDLIIYNFFSGQSHTQPVATSHHPYFLPSGELLAAGDHQLIKYKVESATVTPVWTFRGLENITRVCVGADGLIYGSTRDNRKSVYIISPNGEKLHELTHDKLPAVYSGQISISGSELVVPGWYEERVCIFKIER